MDMLFQWLLLTAAVAAGWFVGRYFRAERSSVRDISDESSVRERLQFLFTNYSDQAVENFVQSLAVNRRRLACTSPSVRIFATRVKPTAPS